MAEARSAGNTTTTLKQNSRVGILAGIPPIVIVLGIGLIVILMAYGTINPCGILRERMRQQANNEGSFSGFIAGLMPDSVLDWMIADQYGSATPGRCLVALLGTTTPQNAPSRNAPVIDQAAAAREKAEQQERNFIVGLDAFVQRMNRFDNAANTQLAKMPAVEQQYSSITSQMRTYLQRERALVGNPDAGVARAQISVAMSQASIATDQLHIQVQQTQMGFDNEARPFMNQVMSYKKACNGTQGLPENNSLPPDVQDQNDACLRFIDAEANFKPKFEAFDRGLSHLEVVYQQESRVQEELVNESTRIE